MTRTGTLLLAEPDADPSAEEPTTESRPKERVYSTRDDLEDFLGWNATTPVGAIGATATVSFGWVFFVELVKFIDPNPSSPSMFSSLF